MTAVPALDEELLRRLPLPLAQLYLRAGNAKTPLGRHLAAYYLWETSLKLLAAVAVVEYARLGSHDPKLVECLTSLARPSLGHWWEYVRRLLPALADTDPGLQKARDILLGRGHDDLPRAAGLDAALREALGGQGGARGAVPLSELFDRLVRYRNREFGHGAAGQRPRDFYERMGQALLLGTAQVLGRLDVLAGRRLFYVAEVRQSAGSWLVERYELIGESARRIESLAVPLSEAARLPVAERVYLQGVGGEAELHPLHPLLLYEPEAEEVLFLNSRRGRRRAEYLCYTSGRVTERPDLGGEQRQLLAQVLGLPVAEEQAERWAAQAEAEEPPAEEAAPGPGHRVGEFELLSELGRGGMGVVYRAWQPSLGRQIALKCLLPGDAKAEARFSREIRALGRVEHPHLVKVFTSGAEEGAQWFYAMELVEGATLAAVSDKLRASTPSAADVDPRTWQEMLDTACEEARRGERPLGGTSPPAPQAREDQSGDRAGHTATPAAAPGRNYVRHVVELVRQAAEAAHALHEAGVIHRDIKPGNVMVTAEGGRAVLMDLGLAQLADAVEGRLTRTRQFVGTLRYASPQQVLAVARLDRRTDVYSLGATLWELLTLRPLYGADDQTSPPELMERIQRQEPERPRKYHPGLPRDLEAVVLKCLEKDPARRYATARDLAEDVRRVLNGEPVQARPVGGVERGWRWMRRRPAAAALLLVSGLALLGLVGGGVAAYYGAWLHDAYGRLEKAKESLEKALAQTDQARTEAEKAQHGEEAQRQRAEAALDGQKDLLYFLSIDRAHSAWRENDVPRMVDLLKHCDPQRRQWEWRYLWHLCHSDLYTLTGHTDQVNSVCFSPDGSRLASASDDQTVKVWDAKTGQAALSFRHTSSVRCVCFSPDGARLATASGDGAVQVWDAKTREEQPIQLSPVVGPGWVNSVCFSPDGAHLAGASEDGTVKVWEANTSQEALLPREVVTLRGHTGPVKSVCFSPDGKRLASASEGRPSGKPGEVKVWDAKSGHEQLTLTGHTGQVNSVCFSPDGTRLATASQDQTVKVWDARTGRVALTLRGHAYFVQAVCFSPDGARLASVGGEVDKPGEVKVWDAKVGQEVFSLKGHTELVASVCFSPDGNFLATASWDHTVKVWDAKMSQDALTLQGHAYFVQGVCFSPDGSRLATASRDETVKVWDVRTGKETLTLSKHTDRGNSVCFSPDGTRLASASERPLSVHPGEVKVWDAETGKETLALPGYTEAVNAVCFSPDGSRLASASGRYDARKEREYGEVKVWDAKTGREALTLKEPGGQVLDVCFSPDGSRLAGASVDGTVKVWDAKTGRVALTLAGHTGPVHSVCFGPPDGAYLASASEGGTVKVWDAKTGRVALTLAGHTGPVHSVCFSPDGSRLATASGVGVKVWDAKTGQETLTLQGHTSTVWGVCFSPDGARLASASAVAKVWDASPTHRKDE